MGKTMTSQLKTLLNPNREKTMTEKLEDDVCGAFPSMTYTQRLYGCLTCMCLGLLFSLGAWFRFADLLMGNPLPFVVAFTLWNIIALAGSCFLSGCFSQMKSMFAKTRVLATVMYLCSIAGTLVVAFALKGYRGQGLLIVVCCVLQYMAVIWYMLSYIPFAREYAGKCCASCCSDGGV